VAVSIGMNKMVAKVRYHLGDLLKFNCLLIYLAA